MSCRSLVAVLLVVASLCGCAAAAAQTTTMAAEGADVSPQPPVQLLEVASGELANTGTDPRLLFAAGAALTLLGVGLRLRTADADLY